jgi:hypothetical protein
LQAQHGRAELKLSAVATFLAQFIVIFEAFCSKRSVFRAATPISHNSNSEEPEKVDFLGGQVALAQRVPNTAFEAFPLLSVIKIV